MWFAFIFVFLLYEEQHSWNIREFNASCDLLSFLYFCSMRNNHIYQGGVLLTLWFAFIFVFLLYEEQLRRIGVSGIGRCDLLSFLYFCSMRNNILPKEYTISLVVICFHFCIFALWGTTSSQNSVKEIRVVICFHFCIFALWGTTHHALGGRDAMLWFAFIFVFLLYEEQHTFCSAPRFGRCDLLSFLYFCSMRNNHDAPGRVLGAVVICFHFCIFALWGTTLLVRLLRCNSLWFAFIFVFLLYEEQPQTVSNALQACCDLLSFLYFCSMRNNIVWENRSTILLWFAFIFVFLLYEEQLIVWENRSTICCDLLSFLYFCSMRNNIFAKSTFASRLWFAFIFVFLLYEEQRLV